MKILLKHEFKYAWIKETHFLLLIIITSNSWSWLYFKNQLCQLQYFQYLLIRMFIKEAKGR